MYHEITQQFLYNNACMSSDRLTATRYLLFLFMNHRDAAL